MKGAVAISIVVGAILVLGGGYWFLFGSADAPMSTTGLPDPIQNTRPGLETNSNTPRSIAIKLRDFKKDVDTVADKQNPGTYYLAGNFNSPKANPDFTIAYSDTQQFFTVALWREPLSATRLDAEKALLSKLGISQSDACQLAYAVVTTSDINSEYSGINLGFSFCPGAVQLP